MLNYEFIKSLNYERLKRGDLGDNLRFDEVINYLSNLADDFSFFQGKEESLLDLEKEIVTRHFNVLKHLVEQILSFEYSSMESLQSAKERRREIVENIRKVYTESISQVLPIKIKLEFKEKKLDFELRIQNFEKK